MVELLHGLDLADHARPISAQQLFVDDLYGDVALLALLVAV